jgi:hypothetical protein
MDQERLKKKTENRPRKPRVVARKWQKAGEFRIKAANVEAGERARPTVAALCYVRVRDSISGAKWGYAAIKSSRRPLV